MQLRKILLLSFILAALPGLARAGFRDELWGARPLSLGGAYLGTHDDAYIPFYNPAGVAGLTYKEIAGTYGKPVRDGDSGDRNAQAVSIVFPSSHTLGSWGAWWDRSLVQSGVVQNAFAIDWGSRLYQSETAGYLSAGVNVKYLQQSLLDGVTRDRSDLSADLGLQYVPNDRLSFGAVARDINRPKVLAGPDGRLSAQFGAGAAYRAFRDTLLVADVSGLGTSPDLKLRGGVEQGLFGRRLALRAGANADQASFGFGYRTPEFHGVDAFLEYAYVLPFHTDEHDRVHLGSIRIRFGAGEESSSTLVSEWTGEPADETAAKGAVAPRKLAALQEKTDFVLGPDDVIQINVKEHAELDVTTAIDGRGYVKLPYLGDFYVQGMTTDQLEAALTKIYSDFYVQPPVVQVTVRDYNSRVVYVLGAVARPGKFSMKDKPVTLREIIYQAGLPTERAATWRAFIVRQTPSGPVYKHVNLYNILYRGRLEKNVELQTGDIVYVPMTVLDTIVGYIGRIFGPILGLARTTAGPVVF